MGAVEEISNSLFDNITKSALLNKIEFYHNYYELMKVTDNINVYRKQFSERFYRFAKNQKQDWGEIFPQAARIAKEWE